MNYEEDLIIDPDTLDEAWKKQAVLYMEYSVKLAEIDKEKQDEKEKMDFLKAELDSEIRTKARLKEEKITESMIQSCIIKNEEYQKRIKRYNDLVYKHNLLSSAVKAFEHKKKALEKLVELWIGGYYSSPKQKIRTELTSRTQKEKLNKRRER